MVSNDKHEKESSAASGGGTVKRRTLFTAIGGVGAVAAVTPLLGRMLSGTAAGVASGTLDPTSIPKYVTALSVPPAMPLTGTANNGAIDVYSIAVRQFSQQILPTRLPATTVWGYGPSGRSGAFHTPGYTVEAQVNRPVRIIWINQLVDANNHYLPHLFTVDPTLHWANPPGGRSGRDSRPTFTSTPSPYTGPVPLVTHLHGGHTSEESDGYPEAWTLPAASNIPSGYAAVGSYYDKFESEAASKCGVTWTNGLSVYQYANDQRATTLWYHDHALGITRLNVQAGLAGFYLLRGGASDLATGLPGPAPGRKDPAGTVYYELPMLIQDRSFNADGSLFFPSSRTSFGDVPSTASWIPTTDVPPYWNPEYFGNAMVVNGNTWPAASVEPRRYRLRLLNGCNARTLILKIVSNPLATRPVSPALPFWQIGSDGGFLPAPVQLNQLLIAPSERADVIVDFTGLAVGTQLYLINEGPDLPFHGGTLGTDYLAADTATTGQVMKFVVTALTRTDTSTPPSQLRLPTFTGLGSTSRTWQVSVSEKHSNYYAGAPVAGNLGTVNSDGTAKALGWMDPVTETPTLNATELWEFRNYTDDAHPIHIHQVQFQVVNRQVVAGAVRAPESWETGSKDTVIAYPGEYTRVKAKFDIAGRAVYHCHILDHEDNEMMRPIQIS
jgi:bilirubin oxidase